MREVTAIDNNVRPGPSCAAHRPGAAECGWKADQRGGTGGQGMSLPCNPRSNAEQDDNGLSDPFGVVAAVDKAGAADDAHSWTSSVQRKTLSPSWNEGLRRCRVTAVDSLQHSQCRCAALTAGCVCSCLTGTTRSRPAPR